LLLLLNWVASSLIICHSIWTDAYSRTIIVSFTTKYRLRNCITKSRGADNGGFISYFALYGSLFWLRRKAHTDPSNSLISNLADTDSIQKKLVRSTCRNRYILRIYKYWARSSGGLGNINTTIIICLCIRLLILRLLYRNRWYYWNYGNIRRRNWRIWRGNWWINSIRIGLLRSLLLIRRWLGCNSLLNNLLRWSILWNRWLANSLDLFIFGLLK